LNILVIFLGVLTLFYFFILIIVYTGLFRLSYKTSKDHPFVSIIIAARNEAENMPELLDSLARQHYNRSNYEIIIVDDQSQDDTAAIVNSRAEKDDRIMMLSVTDTSRALSPKKRALGLGIEAARGDILLLTDADCRPAVDWIGGFVRLFTPSTGMVIGFSPCELPAVRFPLGHLLALESVSLAAVAAGTTGWGYPATCNGRNLAYRKKVYEQVGGFKQIDHFVSGDDDLLLKLVQGTEWEIRYAYDKELVVPTKLVQNAAHFIRQRLRHASKGFHYNLSKVLLLVLIYFYNVFILLSISLALFSTFSPAVAVGCWGLKSVMEFIVLFRFAHHMRRKRYLTVFPLAEVLHVIYIVVFGILGPFIKMPWKAGNGK